MKNAFYFSVSILLNISVFAQKWVDAGIPLTVSQIRTVCSDTINNRMYVGGFIGLSPGNTAIGIYDGSQWTVKDTIDNLVLSMVIYDNELYMGGTFTSINSQPMMHLVKWNGINWVNIGASSGISNLRVINNELYAVGTFTQIADINANSIAKWDGSSWTTVNFPYLGDVGWGIADCALYQGELYVGGNFATPNGLTDIAVLKNGTWQRVGNSDSLKGSFSSINKLEIYQNELYIAGQILHSEGNIGNGIQRWDGVNWKTVGSGVQGPSNSINELCQIFDMRKHKDKLIVGGGFFFAGNSSAPFLASWDGTKWCAKDTLIDKPITAFGIFRDTIFVGTNSVFEGNYVNSFAKFNIGNYNYTEKCSINFDVGINEKGYNNFVAIYPNPTSSILNITDEQNQFQNSVIEIKNTLGQVIISSSFQKEIDMSCLQSGMYFIEMKDYNGNYYSSKIIKE